MKQYFDLLGLKVQDRVTNFTGIVTSISFDLYGCVQAIVTPEFRPDHVKEEHLASRWFDTKRLHVINPDAVMDLPTFEAVAGPAPKPIKG